MRFFRLLSYYTIFLYTTDYSCCFHIFTPFLYSKMCKNPSIYAGFWDLLVYSNYTSPEPILPLFSFVLAGHKGLEDLGRVVVFVHCQYHTFCRNYEQNFQLFLKFKIETSKGGGGIGFRHRLWVWLSLCVQRATQALVYLVVLTRQDENPALFCFRVCRRRLPVIQFVGCFLLGFFSHNCDRLIISLIFMFHLLKMEKFLLVGFTM